MIKSRQLGQLVFSVVFAGVLCGPSHAELIAEIGINIPPAFEDSPPVTDAIIYGFVVSSNTPTLGFGEWIDEFTMNDVGTTFEAPPNMAASFARALTSPTASVTISVHRTSYSRPLDQLQTGGWGIIDGTATFKKFVPDITKVPVTRLTMTIDAFHFERIGGVVPRANIGGGHTIRIYGIPEPGTACLILVLAGSLSWSRRSRR
jgi:hypothetical protein